MRRHIIVLAVALAPAPLSAQTGTAAQWPIGSRVRVWTTASNNVIGQLAELRGDTLIIRSKEKSRPEVRVRSRDAVRLDISVGRQLSVANVVLGALGGAAVGAVTMLILDETLGDICTNLECGETESETTRGALLGAVAGAAFGLTKLEDRWREVGFPGRITLTPSARGAAIGLSLAFR